MSNVFNPQALAGQIAGAKQKAKALAGAFFGDALAGHVLPPVPFPAPGEHLAFTGVGSDNGYEAIDQSQADSPVFSMFGTPMCFPLSLRLTNSSADWWLLPVEPIITLGGGNTVARRFVAKSKLRGSIKERWNVDDYTISIEGLFTRQGSWQYPQEDVARLRALLEARDTIDVKCELLETFGIGRIVVEKYDWPFTKGEENQAYRISAWSDDDWDLLIKI